MALEFYNRGFDIRKHVDIPEQLINSINKLAEFDEATMAIRVEIGRKNNNFHNITIGIVNERYRAYFSDDEELDLGVSPLILARRIMYYLSKGVGKSNVYLKDIMHKTEECLEL